MNSRAAAGAAARHGWAVFPCRPGDKRPAVDRWEERACADPERVTRFWPSERHNIGVACGPSGLLVIDLDTPQHGGQLPDSWRAEPGVRDGRDVLATLAERGGQPWPPTYSVTTPSGGLHLYFVAIPGREIRNSAGKVGPMIDVRGTGGYVVGAGSVVDGRSYIATDDSDPMALPAWLAALAGPRQAAPVPQRPAAGGPGSAGPVYYRLRGIIAAVLGAPEGQRNGVLHWAACRAAELVTSGEVGQDAALAALTEAAEAIGLGAREIKATIASGMRGRA